jgi:hypothetical protein
MKLIFGDEALADFRRGLTGAYALELLRDNGGRVHVQLPVGVGKSRWLDAVTVEAVESGTYDLAVVLCPTRRVIEERAPLRNPPVGLRVVNLRPRPVQRCGPERNELWRVYERQGLGAYGRAEVCSRCPHFAGCFWPGQYGAALRGARIVYATQAHLKRSPTFLAELQAWAGAERMLTLLDEAGFVGPSPERVITRLDLERFADAMRRVAGLEDSETNRAWLALTNTLLGASTEDLQAPGWSPPRFGHGWALRVQSAGVQAHGDDFRFPAYDITQFAASPGVSRSRDVEGVHFGVLPLVGDCMVFSHTAGPLLVGHLLGGGMAAPFSGHRIAHPGTRWYNLASRMGTRAYFRVHAPQVLDFFAGLVARRVAEGRRPLLVAKKGFVQLCVEGLAERFSRMGVGLEVLTGSWSEEALARPGVVPLINYGAIGTNLFEGFDAAYCLTGYYVNENAVVGCVQGDVREGLRLPVRIETFGRPPRRTARVPIPDAHHYDVAHLVQPALETLEHGTVIQAVGRVRPFTRPREVITFQMAELPGVAYDGEFTSLQEMREFFGVESAREGRTNERARRADELRATGMTQREIAEVLGISERTVRQYQNRRTGN